MCEEKREDLSEDITSFENTCEGRDFNPVSKVKSKSHEDKINTKCSWSVILLALTRLGLQLASYSQRTPSVIIKANGTTTLNHIIRINKLLKYPHVPSKVPVLSLILAPLTLDNALSVLSSLGMIVAVILSCARLEGRLTQGRPRRDLACFLLISLCLLNTATDLAHCLGASFTHHHLLQANVGAPDALGFSLISIAINIVQWILWYGGLEFQKSLLST